MTITDKCLCTSEDTYRLPLRPISLAYYEERARSLRIAQREAGQPLKPEVPDPVEVNEESWCAACHRFTVVAKDSSKRRWQEPTPPPDAAVHPARERLMLRGRHV